MDAFCERLIVRAATIDELLSDDFEPLPGQKGDTDLAARRLAAWCRSCASGDWSLFARRLNRDGLSFVQVLERFASVRRTTSAAPPAWLDDGIWIEAALQGPIKEVKAIARLESAESCPFEDLFTPVVEQAELLLRSGLDAKVLGVLNEYAHACLRDFLLRELTDLSAPAIYERFVKARDANVSPADAAAPLQHASTSQYNQFVAAMRAGGFRRLFEDKPVLLRLIASTTRQWINTSREFVLRLADDLPAIRRDLLQSRDDSRVAKIEGELSDPHNDGHSVRIVSFEDGSRVVYKPKDLRVDAAWYALVERLNRAAPPIELKAARAILRDGYGWTEFIDHVACADQKGCERFFRRAGAWLALFHCFAATDMHQENMIATGDHPVPIDLEMILQASEEQKSHELEEQAFQTALETVANSVTMVGLLPAYGRSPENNVFAVGGMTANWNSRSALHWANINSDQMRPTKSKETGPINPNLPHVDGQYAKFGDHIEVFIAGFDSYAKFLLYQSRDPNQGGLFDGFADLPVRRVIRPTRFYYMLLQRLKDHRTMDDGVIWSAQADFAARLSDWEKDCDRAWPLQRAERSALVTLNVPHFVSPSDGTDIRNGAGISIPTRGTPGLDRARARVRNFSAQDIAWQVEVIRQNTSSVSRSTGPVVPDRSTNELLRLNVLAAPARETFVLAADKIAAELSSRAISKPPGAAWIGIDWLGDSEVSQLTPLGPDLYNGVSGIAVFLAAHAASTGREASSELALAGVAHLRKNLRSRNAARMARALGVGGAIGLGSVVYALTVMSKCLNDNELLADACVAAELFTDDLIAADRQLDVMAGSAGAILSLLRLYRDTQSSDPLKRATKCGEHLLGQRRSGSEGRRTWLGQGAGSHALNGMSHGAAGFAYALASLSAATGRQDFASAAEECLAFEDSSYNAERNNWPDLRLSEPAWPCQWCHGATGIGLARIAMTRRGGFGGKPGGHPGSELLATDIRNALEGVERNWPGHWDTLCCGTLGGVEFLCEAASTLGRSDLRALASRRLLAILQSAASTGDFRWSVSKRQFNLGLFRGLAGVGYTLLRQSDGSLPNVLIWE